MNRIEALSSFINEDDKVIDVGCDQAKLGIMLAYRGIKSIGSDISDKVITKAQETIDKLDLNSYMEISLDDFKNNITFRADCGSIAGRLVYEVYNNDEIITEDVISSELNTYGTIDIASLTNYEKIKIIVSYYPIIGNSSNIEIVINN